MDKKITQKRGTFFEKEDPKKMALQVQKANRWRTVIKRKFTVDSDAIIISSLFFAVPFAISGDKVPIPNPIQPSGAVSYTTGWGADYSADPEINPSAKQVPRVGFNELFYEITLAQQQYQVWGVPNFITEEETVDGNPFPYSKYAFALFDDGVNGPRIFQSNTDTNTQVPVVATLVQSNWSLIDSVNAQATVFNNVTFDTAGGGVANNQCVYWNTAGGGKYSLALANGAEPQNALGFADATNSRVMAFGIVPGFSGLTPGSIYYLSTTTPGAITATKPANNVVQVGLARDATTLFVNIQVEIPGAFLPVGTMLDYAGGTVPPGYLLCDGSAISRTTYAALFNAISTTWGVGDGSSTFNIPNAARAGTVGSGGTVQSGPSNTTGSTYTAQLQAIPGTALPAHVHGISDPGHTHGVSDPGHIHGVSDPGHTHGYVAQQSPGASAAGGEGFVGIIDADVVASGTGISIDAHGTDISIVGAATGVTVDSTGAGSATLPTYGPSIVVTKIIYTGVI